MTTEMICVRTTDVDPPDGVYVYTIFAVTVVEIVVTSSCVTRFDKGISIVVPCTGTLLYSALLLFFPITVIFIVPAYYSVPMNNCGTIANFADDMSLYCDMLTGKLYCSFKLVSYILNLYVSVLSITV